VVLCTGLTHLGEAQALALGRIMVQSALGEPLKAEIDVPDINTDEAASLRVGLASGDAFRAAGMDFNAALSSLQITLQRRANGSAYLRLTSTRPVNEPFVDLIVEANWASGRIVRDYTLLLDPPNLRTAAYRTPCTAGRTGQLT
jgi:pilus assembly protein FimV